MSVNLNSEFGALPRLSADGGVIGVGYFWLVPLAHLFASAVVHIACGLLAANKIKPVVIPMVQMMAIALQVRHSSSG